MCGLEEKVWEVGSKPQQKICWESRIGEQIDMGSMGVEVELGSRSRCKEQGQRSRLPCIWNQGQLDEYSTGNPGVGQRSRFQEQGEQG